MLAWFLLNPWRGACLAGCAFLLLALGIQSWRVGHWESKYEAKVAENALAADANAASQIAIRTLRDELVACNRERAVYAANVEAVQASRAKAEAQAAAKLAKAQSALQAALEAQKEWAATPVPPEVRKALR